MRDWLYLQNEDLGKLSIFVSISRVWAVRVVLWRVGFLRAEEPWQISVPLSFLTLPQQVDLAMQWSSSSGFRSAWWDLAQWTTHAGPAGPGNTGALVPTPVTDARLHLSVTCLLPAWLIWLINLLWGDMETGHFCPHHRHCCDILTEQHV